MTTIITIGIIFCAAGIEGFFRHRLGIAARLVFGLGGALLLLGYNLVSLSIAVAVIAAAILFSEMQWRAQGRPA